MREDLRIWIRRGVIYTLLFVLLSTAANADSAAGSSGAAGVLGEKTAWATPWYVVDGQEPGPVVFLTGGMHGDEPAGSVAAEQIRHWPIRRGRLIVVPKVNKLGLIAETRWFPPLKDDQKRRDLNRNFPTSDREPPLSPVAEALWDLVQQQQPDVVVDLHEGFDFHISNSKSVGSSIIFSKSDKRMMLAEKMLAAVNATVDDQNRQFELLSRSGAMQGSLVRACTDRLRIDSFILETTYKDQPLSLRARQHRRMVSTLLQNVGLIDRDCVDILSPGTDSEIIRVALYDSAGASSNGLKNLFRVLNDAAEIAVVRVGPADMNAECLKQIDVVMFPGGSGGKQGRAIGESGREAIRGFVKRGGGIVGVCAGAYLCSAHYDWSLRVINTAVFNKTVEIPGVGRKSMWYRGGAQVVQMELENSAERVLGKTGEVSVRYQNGPVISTGKATDLPAFTPLAWFRSEVVKYEPQKGTMINTPAIVIADFGKGRVLSISPHPESTPGLESMIVNGVRWAARKPVNRAATH
jgi:predicted deacylase/glutamine amidotransferase-like uncharacterized protein